jgi:hypothetical protein
MSNQAIFDEAYAVYQKDGQRGVHEWAWKNPALAHLQVYWLHCDPCDEHESPSITDDHGDIRCLVCDHPTGRN